MESLAGRVTVSVTTRYRDTHRQGSRTNRPERPDSEQCCLLRSPNAGPVAGAVLKPENKAYAVIRPKGSLEIFGVVVGMFRRYR